MKSADLFVMSSITEGLGSTVLDAMAMKLAVVGTRAGGIPEAVVHGETGLLVPPARCRARWPARSCACSRIRALRQRMGEAGHARVAEHFGVARCSRARCRPIGARREMNAEHGGVELVGPAERQRVIGAGDRLADVAPGICFASSSDACRLPGVSRSPTRPASAP